MLVDEEEACRVLVCNHFKSEIKTNLTLFAP